MTQHQPTASTPDLGAPTADTHAHLGMLDGPAGALERAAEAGVVFVATVADVSEDEPTFEHLDDWLRDAGIALGSRAPGLSAPETRIIAGVHPHNAKDYTPAVAERLRRLAADPRVCALGELGLDFHYDHSPRDDQRRSFAAQLGLAHETGLPVILHLREAHEEGIAILRDSGVPKAGCLVHCFTEGPAMAERLLEMGCDIAFGGAVTFPKAEEIRQAAAIVPLDRLLAETDCPFLAPVPLRGRTNEPAWVTYCVEKLAEVKGLPTAEVATATLSNARRLFGSAS